jgi:hypothetical protein
MTRLQMLEAQVTTDLLTPLYRRPGFREMGSNGTADPPDFIDEQSETPTGKIADPGLRSPLDTAYRAAYASYLAQQETRHKK